MIPIGRPIANLQVYILDEHRTLLPWGAAGELYVGGVGLARGYFNRSELSAQKFVANPFSAEDDAKLYKTGDIVKWLPDGNLAFIGRTDDQVKIRGYRIEVGEIESTLQHCPLVEQCVVVVQQKPNQTKHLIAYAVAKEVFDKEVILSYLKSKLPEYMIPAVLVEMPSFPRTINGKIDRRQLPDPDETPGRSDNYQAPSNATEETLVGIWQHLLGVERVGVNDNFFELGGHSLLATKLVASIKQKLSKEVAIKEVFSRNTIAELAALLVTQDILTESMTVVPIQDKPERIPLSFSQEGLWFIDQLEGSIYYHLPSVLMMEGPLDVNALAYAYNEIVNRHQVLRTVFRSTEGIAHQVVKEENRWTIDYAELPPRFG